LINNKKNRLGRPAVVATAAFITATLSFGTSLAASAYSWSGVAEVTGMPNYSATIDCDALVAEGIDFWPVAGGSVTITTTNCVSADVMDVSKSDRGVTEGWGYTAGGVQHSGDSNSAAIPATFTIDSNTKVNLIVATTVTHPSSRTEFLIRVNPLVAAVANPAGTLSQTSELTIPKTNPLVATFPRVMDATNTACSFGAAGQHPYKTIDVDVTKEGVHTFRFVKTSVLDQQLFWWGDYLATTLGDPYLALYSTFDSTNPTTGLVACNNRSASVPVGERRITQNGFLLSDTYAEISKSLPVGHYTLLLTTGEVNTASDWATANTTLNVSGQTGSVEVWKPAETPASEPALAVTGFDQQLAVGSGVLGAVALGVGFIALAFRRRSSGK
jgi:hypothetical protein